MSPRLTDSRVAPGRRFELVVIGASLGGLDALHVILGDLPRDFPLPIAIVLHRTRQLPNLLAQVLQRWTALEVRAVTGPGVPLKPGTVYVAPPDLHLQVRPDRVFTLTDGRRIHHVLSSADPLFESAATALGEGVIAVVLSGLGSDATGGVKAVKAAGGVVIAQDEKTSRAFSMPRSAIGTGTVDLVLPLDRIAPALLELAREAAVRGAPAPEVASLQ